MAHYTYVIKEIIKPEEQLGSVIDTLDTLGQILQTCQKAREGAYFDKKDSEYITVTSLFALNFFPFWVAHGASLRPLLLKAFDMEGDVVKNFMIDAIPTAMTIAMPNQQLEYINIRNKAIALFNKDT